ncbi:MAG: hypothetical protein ABIN96_17310 [Rubrivivax sp.]
MAAPSKEQVWLTRSLRDRLLAALVDRRFVHLPLSGEDARSAEIATSFPLGRMRREAGAHVDQIEIQVDKHNKLSFRLNFARYSADGIDHVAGRVASEDVWIHYLPRYQELYEKPLIRQWWAVRLWPGQTAAEKDYQELCERAVACLDEIEAALDGAKPSLWSGHVRTVG